MALRDVVADVGGVQSHRVNGVLLFEVNYHLGWGVVGEKRDERKAATATLSVHDEGQNAVDKKVSLPGRFRGGEVRRACDRTVEGHIFFPAEDEEFGELKVIEVVPGTRRQAAGLEANPGGNHWWAGNYQRRFPWKQVVGSGVGSKKCLGASALVDSHHAECLGEIRLPGPWNLADGKAWER